MIWFVLGVFTGIVICYVTLYLIVKHERNK